ncbi:neural cell adhesion molecule 2-like [Anneissia japonica]|uniref:neural cell adhesion molecule 2-like n=1 Tax=Anneissia japonica TaxID=1529436 RepID=UPI001425B323|nr:neural cell adhesion molecule 2-like [Anneissia japonica]
MVYMPAEDLRDVVVFEGQNAFFEYSSPVQASSWAWYRTRHVEAAALFNDGKYVIFVNGMRTASNLTVLNVTRADDQTKYHYERDGLSSNSATLTVITPLDPTDVVVFEGQNAFFEYSSPVQASSWAWYRTRHREASRVSNDGKYVIFVNGMRTASNLTVLNVTRADDQTKYHCERDHFSSISASLTVITPLDTGYPKCTITNTIDNIHVGEIVEIVCTAIGGIPRPSLHWLKNNSKLKETDDFTPLNSSATHIDVISISLSNEDNGVEFKCKADGISVVGNQSCSVVPLSIQPNVSIIVNKMSYDAGDSLNITCSGEGIPLISEYNWFFNNKHLTSSESMFNIIENGTILEILELQTEHLDAEIRCKVSIPSGLSANKSITLSFTSHDAATGDLIIYIVSGSVLGLLILLGLLVVCIKTKKNQEKKSKVKTSYYANHNVSLNKVELIEMNNDLYSNCEPQPEHPVPMLGSKSVENSIYSDVTDIKQN